MSDPIMVEINPLLSVPFGGSCLIKTKNINGRCWYFKGRACLLFNKVVIDAIKCPQCVKECK